MGHIRSVTACTIVMLTASASCRSHPESWPTDPADLTGQVLEVRTGGGTLTTLKPDTRGYGNGIDSRRLRIRVLAASTPDHAAEAYVMVDGVTQVAKSDAAPASGGHPDLEGAFVRVWLRSKSFTTAPSDLAGIARVIAIDSVTTAPSR